MQKNGPTSQLEQRLGNLKESVRNLVDAGSERARTAKQRAMGMKDSMVDSGGAALDRIAQLIKQHPIASLGVAFSAGYFVIRMLRR